MNALDRLRRRHELLAKGGSELPALSLARAFAAAVRALPDGRLTAGGRAAVELDLVYALLRHDFWINAPLFADVLTDFLATEHLMPAADAAALVRAMLAAARDPAVGREASGVAHVEASDEEFLRFICVYTATAAAEDELVVDLGLGRALLARIREALSVTSASASYVPPLDAQLARVLVELGRDLRANPEALHVHRLRYHLIGIGEPWKSLIQARGARWLHDFLLTLSSRRTMTLKQVAAKLGKLLPGEPRAATDAFAGELLQALVPFALAHQEGPGFRALPLAEELTADAYARQRLNTPKEPWDELPELCGAHQAAVLRTLDEVDASRLESLLASPPDRALAPAAISVVLSRLAEAAGTVAAAAGATRLLAGATSSWRLKAACDALAGCAQALPIAEILGDVARSGPSPAVRAAALRAALRHRDHD